MRTLAKLLATLLIVGSASAQYPANPQKPITYINRARSTQPGGLIIFDDPVLMNGIVYTGTNVGGGGGGSLTSGTYLSITQAGIFASSAGTVLGGTNALSWGVTTSLDGVTLPDVSACYSFVGYGTNDTMIVTSTDAQGPAIIGLSYSGSPGIVAVQEEYYTAPALYVTRISRPGDPTTTIPALDVTTGTESLGPVAAFKNCTTSGDNAVLMNRDGSITLDAPGVIPTSPQAGSLAYLDLGSGKHFYGRGASAWVQLDGGSSGGMTWPLTSSAGGNLIQLSGPYPNMTLTESSGQDTWITLAGDGGQNWWIGMAADGTLGSDRNDFGIIGNGVHYYVISGGVTYLNVSSATGDATNKVQVQGGLSSDTFTTRPAAAAPASPVAGQIYFNSSTHHFMGYNGSAWAQLDN
jgi:hypothetical protein